MNYIKKFRLFEINEGHRIPERVGDSEWSKKLETYKIIDFTEQEMEFLTKFGKKWNGKYLSGVEKNGIKN